MNQERNQLPIVRANIVSWDGGGLGTDVDLLWRLLQEVPGCSVSFKGASTRRASNRAASLTSTAGVLMKQKLSALTGKKFVDVNFFVESVFPEFLPLARTNCLFVHPEILRDSTIEHFDKLDWVLCKTPSAVSMLDGLPARMRYVAFTSPDKRIVPSSFDTPLKCLHISGASYLKGSEAVVSAWGRHPEWPELIVVRNRFRYGGGEAAPLPELPNVRYRTDHLSDAELRALQNSCGVHVIPSEAEGYGHIIGEGLSCGAVVVTTDAPPMNELVNDGRGILVRVQRSEPLYRSQRNFVDPEDFDRKLTEVFAMSPAQRAEIGQRARTWYESESARFRTSLHTLIDEVRMSAQSARIRG